MKVKKLYKTVENVLNGEHGSQKVNNDKNIIFRNGKRLQIQRS